MTGTGRVERGRVSLRADPDSDRLSISLFDGDVITFGRGVDCELRFGHAPVIDRSLSRRSGALVVANGRIAVQAAERVSSDCDAATIRRPVTVKVCNGPSRPLASGEIWGPNAEIFTVSVCGESTWLLDVVNFRDGGFTPLTTGDPPSVMPRVELTDELWQVLRAYAEPMLRGERFPATHEQVAERINWNRMTARRRLERIYDEFYLRRIDMPDVADMRIKVVEAALSHGLLDDDVAH